MPSATQGYRRLSSWQGFFSGAALFRDEHCLMSVRRSGFEECVKRLHFSDIKAIVVSKSGRFGVSRRMILIALLLVAVLSITSRVYPILSKTGWTLVAVLAVTWFYIALRASCRCVVYTAVSREELHSVRRPWTARKVLAEIAPLIEGVQGTLPVPWRESVAHDQPLELIQARSRPDRESLATKPAARRVGRGLGSAVLVASLLLDVLLTTWDLQRTQAMPNWIGSALALVEATAALWVLIQNRGMDVSLQRLGAVVLIFLGLSFYAQTGIVAVAQFQSQIRNKRPLQPAEMRANPLDRNFKEIYIGVCLVLSITGAVLTLAESVPRRQHALGD